MDQSIEALIRIKWYTIRRNYLKSLTLQDFRDCLYAVKWTVNPPVRLAVAAKDIEELTVNDIANYLSSKGVAISFDLNELEDEGTK